jgi:hypothetical protein
MTTSRATAQGLHHSDFPGLFQAADQASIQGQRTYLRAVRARLTLSVLAAASAAVTIAVGTADIAAIGTALLFVGALGVDVLVLRGQPNQTWYQGRALAESTKTLAWRYAVGGAPFPLSVPAIDADKAFVDRLAALRGDLAAVPLLPTRAGMISDRMRALRAAPLPERQRTYLTGRIDDQQVWYADKAQFHRRQARLYQGLMLVCEIAGVAAALAKAFEVISFDLAGIVAATISALAAWTAARQHAGTAHAYVVASHDLGLVREHLRYRDSEAEWAAAVADAEAAISREHSTWRSSQLG